jgi:PTS system beta-glucosides-specific IIC component
VLSYVYHFFQKHIPDIAGTIFTPVLTLFLMIPLQMIVFAPLGYGLGEYIAKGVDILLGLSPVIAGFIVGAARPFMVFTGMHHAMRVIVQQQISSFGGTTIGAMNSMSVFAQATAPLAVYLVTKSRKMKKLSMSAAVSGYLGVTEPALYSVIVKYKIVLIATAIGGGIGGAIVSAFGSAEYAMVMSGILTIPATVGEGFMGIVIGIPVTVITTLLIVFLGRKSIIAQDEAEGLI